MSDAEQMIGARRLERVSGPDAEIVKALARCDTTDLSDAMQQANHLDSAIRPLREGMPRFAGPAVTVVVPTGSQAARKDAMALCQPGDVLVVAARGAPTYAVLGGNLARTLCDQGLAGAVIDGCVRDAGEIREHGLSVVCRGQTPAAAPKSGPGEVNVPVACGGVVIAPGDIVVADVNGVVVVPTANAEQVLRLMQSG